MPESFDGAVVAALGSGDYHTAPMLEIRPIRPDEVPLAHGIELRSYPAPEAASLERFRARAERFPDGFLVLREEGEMRAFVCAVRSNVEDLGDEEIKAEGGHDPEGEDLVILSVATEAGERGRGLGGLLMDAIAVEAQRLRLRRMRLLCKENRVAFYARHGWRLVGPSSSQHGGARWMEMERRPGLARDGDVTPRSSQRR